MSELLQINVSGHTEKKNGLTYLSWAWAWAEVLKIDPEAEWEAVEFCQPDGTSSPCMYVGNGSALVKTKVTIKGKTRVCLLPVMDHRNKAIPQPDAFQINTAIMRCMTKAISMHGIGLYIYAGEDLPPMDTEALNLLASELAQLHNEGLDVEACQLWYGNKHIKESNEAREYVWLQLKDYSALRAAIKANKPVAQPA